MCGDKQLSAWGGGSEAGGLGSGPARENLDLTHR